MPEITAAAVKALRERTGLPMMECKKALQETGGDEEAAVERCASRAKRPQETRLGRETSAGRIAVYTDMDKGVGAMVELLCESAPVATSPEFGQFANDLAKQLATGPGAKTRRRVAQAAVAEQAGPDARRREGRHVQPHSRGVQPRPHRADRRPRPAAMPITRATLGVLVEVERRQRRPWPRTSPCTWRP